MTRCRVWKDGQNPPREIVRWATDGSSGTLLNHAAWAVSGSTIEHPAPVDAEVRFDRTFRIDQPRKLGRCPGACVLSGAYAVFTGASSLDDCCNPTGGPSRGILMIKNFRFTPG